jgi:hypothetical protein
MNSNENVIYEAVTDTNDLSYLVTLDQIYDIVGEEDWIHGESNCLVNLASGQMITLSWGAKKKERKEQRRVLKVCKLAIMFLLKIMVINGHTKLKKLTLTWKTILL